MSNTPKTDKLFFPYGRDHTAAASPSFLTCMTEYELLEKENAAQLAELTRIAEALGTNEGHSSVTHIEILKKENAALLTALEAIATQPREGDIPQQVVRMQRVARAAIAAKKEPNVTHSRVGGDHAIVMVGGGGGGGSAAKEEGK